MNNGPKSFKEMIFPPSRDGRNSVYAPLPPPQVPRTIGATESERRTAQIKELKLFINNERCPICLGQLDGPIGYDGADVFCRTSGGEEYRANYVYGLNIPTYSVSTFYTTNFGFEIVNNYIKDNNYLNNVFKLDLNLTPRFRQGEKKTLISYEGERLLLKGTWTEDKLLKKMKLYTVFS